MNAEKNISIIGCKFFQLILIQKKIKSVQFDKRNS
jgi:hypothetical protein